jgi:hypothetical protein
MHPFRIAIEARDIGAAVDLLAEDVVFRSPVAFRSYQGRQVVEPIIRAVSTVLEDFKYVHEIGSPGASDHALVFEARVGGRRVEGCDLLHENEDGSIGVLAVLIRPLSGAVALRAAMEARAGVETLPYLDEHAIRIDAPRELVWLALQRSTSTSLGMGPRNPLQIILGATPPGGFEVLDSVPPERLTFVGQHRFSQYMLRFELTDAADGATQLRAQTYAAFPGLLGGLYRAGLVGTGAHAMATNHILRAVRPLSLELAAVLPRNGFATVPVG